MVPAKVVLTEETTVSLLAPRKINDVAEPLRFWTVTDARQLHPISKIAPSPVRLRLLDVAILPPSSSAR
jgi:hypothetical protein